MGDPVAGPALPLAFVESEVATTQTGSTTLAAFTTLTVANDNEQFLNGLIDRPTTTRFRALVRGYYRIHYALIMRTATNNRAAQARVLRNGTTTVTGTTAYSTAQNTDPRAQTATLMRVLEMQANDYLEIQFANTEAGNLPAVVAGSKVLFELVRPI